MPADDAPVSPSLRLLAPLCVAYAMVRVWYTVVVNMGGLFDDSAAAQAMAAAFNPAINPARVGVSLAVALLATRIKMLNNRRWLILGAAALLMATSVLVFIGGDFGGVCATVGTVAGIACGLGSDVLYLAWSQAFVRYDDRGLCLFMLAKCALDALLSPLAFAPRPVLVALCLAMPVLCAAGLVLAGRVATGFEARRQHRWHAIDRRMLPPLIAGITVLFFAFSFSESPFIESAHAQTLSAAQLTVIGRWLTFALVAVGLYLARDFHFEVLYRIAALTGIVGFLLRMVDLPFSDVVYIPASIASTRIAEDATVMVLVSVSRYSTASPLAVLAWGRVCFRAGAWVAVFAANAVLGSVEGLPAETVRGCVCAIEVALLAVTGMWLLREQRVGMFLWGRGASERPQGADSSPGTATGTAGQAELVVSPRCRYLAGTGSLTERETEVLALLLDGRSVPYIQETLHISANTAKTHIRHIYQKFDVHNRQDLITLAQTAPV